MKAILQLLAAFAIVFMITGCEMTIVPDGVQGKVTIDPSGKPSFGVTGGVTIKVAPTKKEQEKGAYTAPTPAPAALKVSTPVEVETTFAATDEQKANIRIIVAVAQEAGIDVLDMLAVAKLESNIRTRARSPLSSAAGICQFLNATAKAYGLADPFDAEANVRAAAALWKDNEAYLRRKIGREPTGAEQYLAHQQGPAGAVRLILGGNTAAAVITGNNAIALNLPKGSPKNPTAAQFVAIWEAKFLAARAQFTLKN